MYRLTSVYNEFCVLQEQPNEPEESRGSLHVTFTYDPMAAVLTVKLIEVNKRTKQKKLRHVIPAIPVC